MNESRQIILTPEDLAHWGIQFEDSEQSQSESSQYHQNQNDILTTSPIISKTPPNLPSSSSIQMINMIVPETELTQSLTPTENITQQQDLEEVTEEEITEEEVSDEEAEGILEEADIQSEQEVEKEKEIAASSKKHHTGPYKIQYIEDPKSRKKTFNKRKATHLKNSEHIHVLTNARVNVEIEYPYPNGKVFSYDSEKKEYENIGIQTDPIPQLCPLKRLRQEVNVFHTPTKGISPLSTSSSKRPKLSVAATTPLVVHDMPNSSKVCVVCNRKQGSEEDKKFRKGKGRKTEWIKCDRGRCKYRAHAMCADLVLTPGREPTDHPFLCPKHKKR